MLASDNVSDHVTPSNSELGLGTRTRTCSRTRDSNTGFELVVELGTRDLNSSPEFECVTWSLTSLLANIRVFWMNNYYLLQSATGWWYKVRQLWLLPSATRWHYKVQQLFYYKVWQVLLQSATGITKCNVITKCDGTHGPSRGSWTSELNLDETGDKPSVIYLPTASNFKGR